MSPVMLRTRLSVLATLVTIGVVLLTVVALPGQQLAREGRYEFLVLPPGSTDLVLSRDGRWATLCAVTFSLERGAPERFVQAIDFSRSRVIWRKTLSSPSCCAFPVVAMTPDGETMAVGGGQETLVYARDGALVFTAALGDGRLHSALDMADDGTLLVVGEWEGRVAAFRRGRERPLWVTDLESELMALAISGDGKVTVAALRDQLLLFHTVNGAVIARHEYGPGRIAVVTISRDGSRAGLLWKRKDERMVLEFFDRGRRAWSRDLAFGTVPLLQMDDEGRWLAAGDLLGTQAALYSTSGRPLWQTAIRRTAIAVAPDGLQAAIAVNGDVEVRSLPSWALVTRDRLPGVAHLLRLAGGRMAVLGSLKMEGLPDRMWFWNIRSRER